MSKPWAEMTSHEQDAAIAGLMGWQTQAEHEAQPNDQPLWWVDHLNGDQVYVGRWETREGTPCRMCYWYAWSPTTDLNAAAQVEAEIEQRGLGTLYAQQLIRVAVGTVWRFEPVDWFWYGARATAAQRCEAAYRVLKGASA